MSQFDALLDFGDSTPPETNGTNRDSGTADEFDPFGPSPTIESKGAVDGNLLVDFTAETEISNGTKENGTSEPFELSFEVSTSDDQVAESSTDVAEFSIDVAESSTDVAESSTDVAESSNMSSNPLYDLTDEPASNPLYEFETHTTETTVVKSSSSHGFDADDDSSNPLYDLSTNGDVLVQTTTITKSESSSSNPLYDLMSNGNSGFEEQRVDENEFLVDTTTEQQFDELNNSAQEEELIVVDTPRETFEEFESREIIHDEQPYEDMSRPNNQADNLLDLYENTQVQSDVITSEEAFMEQTAREPSPIREPTPEPVREPTPEPVREPTPEPVREPTPEPVREPSPEPIREPTPEPVREPSPEPTPREEEKPMTRDGNVSRSQNEKRYSDSYGNETTSGNVQSMGSGSVQQNGYDITRETSQKDDIHFSEMSSVRNAFESGGPQQTVESSQSQNIAQWEEEEEGIYENEPAQRGDVVRESDKDIGAELPEVGMAKNLLSKFSHIGNESKTYKREVTPPRQAVGKVEYESQPSTHIPVYEGKAEAGIFESQPQLNPDVVRSGEVIHEPLPEHGTAKNIASKFKQLEKGGSTYTPSPAKRAVTPDRSAGKVEYVSEPTTVIEHYEGKAEAGIFESQPQSYEGVVRSDETQEEALPERGFAKNIAQRFKQMENEPSNTPKTRREITPDRTTRGEYVSEPRGYVETYEGKAEAGIFENRPSERSDVVKSDEILNEPLPERGFTRNVAAKFREMESNMKSPPPTPGRVKEFTPPRETNVVYESQPQTSPDVISENQPVDDIIPEKGYAKNLVSRFKQIEQENSKVIVSGRKKEPTPPRDAGVFENQPQQFVPEYNQKTDSGISENVPEVRSDVYKESDAPKYAEELPERGTAKNMVSRWKQMENQKVSPSSSGRTKEFTPPREDERVLAMRSPLMSPGGQYQSVQPGDLPGQYSQQSEPGIFENQPQQNPDVFREADTDWMEGMPKENAAKKMVAKFKHIQAEAYKEPPKPISKKAQNVRRQ